jgi:hypothetical protein
MMLARSAGESSSVVDPPLNLSGPSSSWSPLYSALVSSASSAAESRSPKFDYWLILARDEERDIP